MSSRPPLGAAKVKRRRRGDNRHRHTRPCLLKRGGHKNLPLAADLQEVKGLHLPFYMLTDLAQSGGLNRDMQFQFSVAEVSAPTDQIQGTLVPY